MFRPVRLARPEDPEALQQHGLNQRSPTEGKGKGQKLPNSTPWTNGHRPKGKVKGRALQQHALNQRSPAEGKGKGQSSPTARPERAEALSPGQRPGLLWTQGCRPVRAKALKLPGKYIKLLPLQGALLIAIIPRALPWAKSFCPFRAYWVNSTIQVELFSVSYKLFFLLL